MSALNVQVGGDHYKKLTIQPMEYSMANKLDACQHTAIKYITRFRDKGGIADLEKAKHCIDMLIEFEQAGKRMADADGLMEAVRFSLTLGNGNAQEFLYWITTGDFASIRRYWPDAPHDKWETK